MIYNAAVKRVCLCGCEFEGTLNISIDGIQLKVYYQAPDEFILSYLVNDNKYIKRNITDYDVLNEAKVVPVDLWLVYGNYLLSDTRKKAYPASLEVCGGSITGEVVSILSEDSFRIDCGILLDVKDEGEIIKNLKVGDYIQTSGTYQIYFPGTDWEQS